MTAVVVIGIALVLGAGLVLSQLFRLRDWLGKSPTEPPGDTGDKDPE